MITSIAFVAYPARDLPVSRAFYETTLGLEQPVFATPVCRMAVVLDPDGNEVILHQRTVG